MAVLQGVRMGRLESLCYGVRMGRLESLPHEDLSWLREVLGFAAAYCAAPSRYRHQEREGIMAVRTSSAEWKGSLKEGAGTMKLASGAYEGPYTYASRFESGQGRTRRS